MNSVRETGTQWHNLFHSVSASLLFLGYAKLALPGLNFEHRYDAFALEFTSIYISMRSHLQMLVYYMYCPKLTPPRPGPESGVAHP